MRSKQMGGNIQLNWPLKSLNSWRVGGDAECFYEPRDREDLSFFLRECHIETPLTVLGLGSNVLIREGGVRGVVMNFRSAFNFVTHRGVRVEAGAGATCAKVARYSAQNGLTGLEFIAGIPGTIGGALAMNAGANGDEIWSRVSAVEVMARDGMHQTRSRDDYTTGYRYIERDSQSCSEWFLSGSFTLDKGGEPEDLLAKIRKLLKQRNEQQPTTALSCGSVFRNPENDYAGRLIEHCGLKNYRIGDAVVSDRHANFIINRGNASANDVEELIGHVKQCVNNKAGVDLTPEVRIIGDLL